MIKHKGHQGFTIVELLIVVVVIAILAAITIVSYNGITSKARDSQRQSSMATVQKKLEAFYTTNGYYPSNHQMQQVNYRTGTLGIPTSLTTPPGTTANLGYCWAESVNMYCYVARNNAATGDCNGDGETCAAYRMSYRLESNPTVQKLLYSSTWQ